MMTKLSMLNCFLFSLILFHNFLQNIHPWCEENEGLRRTSDDLGSLVYQMGHNTEDMVQLAQRTVRDPMKKINGEFPNIQAAIKRRDMALQVLYCVR